MMQFQQLTRTERNCDQRGSEIEVELEDGFQPTLRCRGGLGVVELERRIFAGGARGGGVEREEVVGRLAVPWPYIQPLPN
jgi:hypothetical protein